MFRHSVFDGIDGVFIDKLLKEGNLFRRSSDGTLGAFEFGIVVFAILIKLRCGTVERDGYITAIGSQAVRDTGQLTRIIGNLPPGNDYDVQLIRDGRSQKLTIRLAIRAEDKEIAQQSKNLWPGLYVAPITADLRRQLSIPEALQGVLVTQVQEGSPAAEAGFRQGDVVQDVDKKPIGKVGDFYQALNAGSGREIPVRVTRQNAEVTVTLAR